MAISGIVAAIAGSIDEVTAYATLRGPGRTRPCDKTMAHRSSSTAAFFAAVSLLCGCVSIIKPTGTSSLTLLPGEYVVNGQSFTDPAKAGSLLISRRPAEIRIETCHELKLEDVEPLGKAIVDYMKSQLRMYRGISLTRSVIPPGERGCEGVVHPAAEVTIVRNGQDLFPRAASYEKRGANDPALYPLALRDYTQAAESGDVRAYLALSRMYANGIGTPVDAASARKWRNLFDTQYRSANRVCGTQAVTIAIGKSIAELNERDQRWASTLREKPEATSAAGRKIVVRLAAANLVNWKTEFTCLAKVALVTSGGDIGEPNYVWHTDPAGMAFLYDRRAVQGSPATVDGTLQSLTSTASDIAIKVIPVSDTEYRVIEQDLTGARRIIPVSVPKAQ